MKLLKLDLKLFVVYYTSEVYMEKDKGKKQKWYAAGLHFECSQCGSCCGGCPGYVWVTEEETVKIAEYLKMDVDDFVQKYLFEENSRLSLREQSNYDCICLEQNGNGKRCKIYPVRPEQCRTWPFWKYNIKSETHWLGANKRCPGINRGKLHSAEEIDEIADNSPC